MKKVGFFIIAISALTSCKKEDISQDDNQVQQVAPVSIELVLGFSPINQLNYCKYTYTDADGVYHYMENNMDRKVENVDFAKPFKVMASSGITFYDPLNGPIYDDQLANYQLKKDGVVIDAQSVVTYVYEN